MRPALKRAKIEKPFRVWHDLRHTALTHEAAAGNPAVYRTDARRTLAGLDHGTIRPCCAQALFPGAAERGEDRIFGAAVAKP